MNKIIRYFSLLLIVFVLFGCNTKTKEETKTEKHTHTFELKYDTTKHWNECICGEKKDDELHKGGNATLTEQAICEVCDQKYGSLKEESAILNYKITLIFNKEEGNVEVNKEKASKGEIIAITATPNQGYSLSKIYLNDEEIIGLEFVMPEHDVTLNVVFDAISPSECSHVYSSGLCDNCGVVKQYTPLFEVYGYDIEIYTSQERNPYNIDLRAYGSDVSAYIYEPNTSALADPYANVNKKEFYNNYEPATSYEDSYFRSKHHLMSGDISEQYYMPTEGKVVEGSSAIKITSATYILDTEGNYLGYVVNNLNGEDYIIYYGGGYTSLNDVASYLLAFGTVPANTESKKNSTGQSHIISLWGEYGRVNDSRFSGDITKYPYEPELPNILGSNGILYHEMDFGTTGGYTNSNSVGTSYTQTLYNTGTKISRGAARMVYVADKNVKSIEERHVFYTYNHYNDFQEYLNYYDGWGIRFGNMSAGNEYCGSTSDYNKLGCVPPTKYPEVLLKRYSEVQ